MGGGGGGANQQPKHTFIVKKKTELKLSYYQFQELLGSIDFETLYRGKGKHIPENLQFHNDGS